MGNRRKKSQFRRLTWWGLFLIYAPPLIVLLGTRDSMEPLIGLAAMFMTLGVYAFLKAQLNNGMSIKRLFSARYMFVWMISGLLFMFYALLFFILNVSSIFSNI